MKNNKNFGEWERIPTEIFADANTAVQSLANEIEELVRIRNQVSEKTVLGLATGSTPVPLYKELIRRHKEEGLSFKNVVTFNLDEYYPIVPEHPESYHCFMRQQLFDHIDIPAENIHIPDGNCDREEVLQMCQNYEEAIKAVGGLDIQILGIGRTGHIGFNEPGSSLSSQTRLVTLDSLTRSDAAKDFLGEYNVPRHAITMGVGTIMNARKIYLLAWGRAKAEILKQTIEESPSDTIPASFLQNHSDTRIWIDGAAASELTRRKSPWLISFTDWTPRLVRSAVTDLSLKTKKPLLKLVEKDYQENGLADLITEKGPAYSLNIRIFNEMQHTITGWPGGKPKVEDIHRPERAQPEQKRVVILSPEPSEDVRAMGATINRLISQKHDVTVAYLTSGSLGVPDEEAIRGSELIIDAINLDESSLVAVAHKKLLDKKAFEPDCQEIRKLKATIRKNEARAALKLCGVKNGNIQFLDLPFYEKGKYRQFNITESDMKRLRILLMQKQPHQVFFTGAFADPSSVPSKAFQVMKQAILGLESEEWFKDCWFWQFNASNKEWELPQIDMVVPCSPDELSKKVQAMYQHRSQMQQLPLVDSNRKEIWELIQEKNRNTANRYDLLGMAEYEALECFRRWYPST